MAWDSYVDLYCERLAPGLLGEPLNALSNVAFLVAAWLLFVDLPKLWRPLSTGRGKTRLSAHKDATLLAALIALIGLASLTFHMAATRWAEVLDTSCIGLYLLAYMCLYARHIVGLRWVFAWLAAPLFMAFAIVVIRLAPLLTSWFTPMFANPGVALYLAALIMLLMLTAWSAAHKHPCWRLQLLAALVFVLSLTLRMIDLGRCSDWPYGTHFIWHLLNALVLYLSALALIRPAVRKKI